LDYVDIISKIRKFQKASLREPHLEM